MKIIKLLGLGALAWAVASMLVTREQRRLEQRRREVDEWAERGRWEGEGGASPSGPATPSAVAH